MQQSWAPAARLLAGATGAVLALYGARRGRPVGLGLGLAGAGLLARGATNMEMSRLLGITRGRRAVDIQKAIDIDAPVDVVYRFWVHYENFPRFMTHVREVKDKGNGMSHWVVDGPGGVPVTWDAVSTREIPNEVLAWRSVDGSAIANEGLVRFEPNNDGSTRVQIRLSYNPPGGALGHGLAWLVGTDPKRQLDDDLLRMKTVIETGVPPRDAARP